ncbi:hypothetical protein SAMN05421803_1601, partial [Nocardiopsis flavescens]
EAELSAFAAQPERSGAEVDRMREARDALLAETERLDGPVSERGRTVSAERAATEDAITRGSEEADTVRPLVERSGDHLAGLRAQTDRIAADHAPFLDARPDLRTALDGVRTALNTLRTDRTALETRLEDLDARIGDLTDTDLPGLRALENDLRGLHRDLDDLHTRVEDLEVPEATPPRDDDSDDSDDSDDEGAPPAPGTGRDGTGTERGGRSAPAPGGTGRGRGGTPPPDGSAPEGSRRRGGHREADDPADASDDASVSDADSVFSAASDASSQDGRSVFDGTDDADDRGLPPAYDTVADTDRAFGPEADGTREEAPPAYDAEPSPPHYPYTELLDRVLTGGDTKDTKFDPDPAVVGDLSWPKDLRSVLPPPGSAEVQVFSARVHDLDTLGPDGRSLTGETGEGSGTRRTTGETGEGSGTRRAPAEETGGDERPTPVRRDPDRDDDPDDDPDDEGSGAETTDDERDPADPDVYDGSLTVDRDGEAHDLDYLVGSRMVGPGRLRTDGVPEAVDRSLRGMRPRMPRALREQVLAEVDRIAAEQGMDPFFTGRGPEISVGTGNDVWKVRVRLSSDRPDGEGPPAYRHVPLREGEGTDAVIIGGQERTRTTASGDTLTRGARRGVSVKFTANPLYFGPTFLGDPVGPSITVGASGGTGLRGGSSGGSTKTVAVQAMDNSAPAEVYTTDLRMDLGVTPPAGPPVRAPRAAVVRDGLALVLSGKPEKRPDDAPAHISLPRRPAAEAAADDASGSEGPAPRRNPRTLHGGLPIKVERIVPQGGEEGTAPTHTDLGTWLADRLVPDGAEGATGSGTRGSRGEDARELHSTIRAVFDNDSLQEYLPHLSRGPITLKLTGQDGTSRMVRLASSATEYRAYGHAPHLGELTRHEGTEHTVSSSGSRSRTIGFSVGGGVNIELSLPGGGMTRIDVPTLEYVHSRTLDSESHSSSRTGSRRAIARDIADTEDFLAYRVERDLFVHLEGEARPHAFTGETVEIVSRRDAEALNDAAGGGPRGRDHGENPRPPMAHLRGDTVTDLSGTTVLGLDWPERAADGDDGDAAERDTTVYEHLQRQVLDAVAERHPGMVIPDMARNRSDYALRPGNEEASFGEKKWREVYGLRRNYNVARENTLRILDALSPERLDSGDTDLTSDRGLTIDLAENAAVDPPLTLKGKEVVRPDSVTVHVRAE